MVVLNQELADKEFYRGKSYLDSGMFSNAIDAYDTLLSKYQKFEGSKEGNILIETSYNNRGAAKCQLGLINGDKQLYQSGMEDFEKSVALDEARTDEDRKWLTAYKISNLRKGNLKHSFREVRMIPIMKGLPALRYSLLLIVFSKNTIGR